MFCFINSTERPEEQPITVYTDNHDPLDANLGKKSKSHRDHDRFVKEVWAINYFRIQLIIKFLIAIFAALLLFDVVFDQYPVLFFIHLSAIGCSLLYWGMTALAKKRRFNDSIHWQMAFVLSYCFLIVTALGFTALFYYVKDLIIYLLPVFAVGLFVLLSPKHSFIFLATTHSVFVIASILGNSDTYLMVKNIVNSTIAVILVLVFMRLTFQMKQHEFEQRIIIEERTAELETINQRLHELAATDELTGLPNRRVFMQSLEREMERAHRYKQPFSVMFLDLDNFKHINDTLGHSAGDAALRQFASVLKSSLRDSDMPGRMGGEEFGIILPNTDLKNGALLAERLRQNVEKSTVLYQGKKITFTASIGVAAYSEEISNIDELLRKVDEAKAEGRNCIVQKA
jgi:diguanylate cyclase (GGDEF)-like protein